MNSNYQEEGLRLNGQLLDEREAAAIVAEIRRRVKDPLVAGEIEAFLAGGQTLSDKTRDALMVVAAGVLMQSGS
jgi:hypothetical protein